MKFFWIFILLYSHHTQAKLDQYNSNKSNQLSIFPEVKRSTLDSKDKITDASVRLASKLSPGFTVNYATKLNSYMLMSFNIGIFNHKYENNNFELNGSEKHTLYNFNGALNIHAGRGSSLDIIFFPRRDEVYMSVDGNQVRVLVDELQMLRIGLRQKVFNRGSFRMDFSIHYDLNSSGDFLKRRTGIGGLLQIGMQNDQQLFMLSTGFEQINSETDSLKIIRRDIRVGIKSAVFF